MTLQQIHKLSIPSKMNVKEIIMNNQELCPHTVHMICVCLVNMNRPCTWTVHVVSVLKYETTFIRQKSDKLQTWPQILVPIHPGFESMADSFYNKINVCDMQREIIFV